MIQMIEEEIEQVTGLNTAGHPQEWNVGEIKENLNQIFPVSEDSFKKILEDKAIQGSFQRITKMSAIVEF